MDLRAVIEIDLHGMRVEEARGAVEKALKNAGSGVYVIRCIHGFHGGTRIRDMIWDDFNGNFEPRVKRIRNGFNEGITELVLRD